MRRGFGLVEVLVGAGILLAFFLGLMSALSAALRLNQHSLQLTQANFLLNDGVEAIKMLRNSSWQTNIASLSPTTAYHLSWSSGSWHTVTTNNLIDGQFDQTITLATAYRDGNQDLVSSGTIDPDTRLLSVVVSWPDHGATTTATTTTYITNLFSN